MEKISLDQLKTLTKVIHELEKWQAQNPTAKVFYHLDTNQVSIEFNLPEDNWEITKFSTHSLLNPKTLM